MRKSKIIEIDADNRDKGRAYLLTEMGAVAAEKWATRALLALAKSGVEVPDEAVQAGAAAILSAGVTAFRSIAFDDAEPLLDDMMRCVQFVPDRSKLDPLSAQPIARPLIEDDIDEVTTLFRLRSEVIELHLGFSVTATLSRLADRIQENSSATPTSRSRSAKSSGGGSRRSTKPQRSTV